MATSKKEGKKDAAARAAAELRDRNYRDLLTEEVLFSQWQTADTIVDLLMDKIMGIVKDKELARKVPLFSLVSTMSTVKSTIAMREFIPDARKDDCFLHADDGEE